MVVLGLNLTFPFLQHPLKNDVLRGNWDFRPMLTVVTLSWKILTMATARDWELDHYDLECMHCAHVYAEHSSIDTNEHLANRRRAGPSEASTYFICISTWMHNWSESTYVATPYWNYNSCICDSIALDRHANTLELKTCRPIKWWVHSCTHSYVTERMS